MNPTHDPSLRSFVPVAANSHFPIQNLPYGVFQRSNNDAPSIGVAIGEQVLDLGVIEREGLFEGMMPRDKPIMNQSSLNAFFHTGRATWQAVRARISELLRAENATLRDNALLRTRALVNQADVKMLLPVEIGDYTDFYSSREHATNVGIMLRGVDNALQPNWLHLPVAYHGRASSIVVSGTDLRRPYGQMKPADADAPLFGASKSVDFELELGVFVGTGNALGNPIPITSAEDHLFGMVLVNDWSARDIQAWEYVPLGPFLAKNFGTSISPWVVSLDALEPFRVSGPRQDPAPFPYLRAGHGGAYDMNLEVRLQSPAMDRAEVICRSNAKHVYWSIAQQLAHHTVNGCNVRAGDLLASGTISGPTPDSYGSMLELAWRGTKPLPLPGGETRSFIQDGDRLTMTGWCEGDGYRVGFGEVTGRILAANPWP